MSKLLTGMLHLPALPGAPRAELPLASIEERAIGEARLLHESGFDAAILENFGDAPFFKERVESITIASMTRIAAAVRKEVPLLRLGINVLRNDARAALGIACAVGASFIRVNVHVGGTATDQGMIEGRASETLRLRRELGADVAIWADVQVKHGRSLAHAGIAEEAADAVERGLADALIVSGPATGKSASREDVLEVKRLALGVPIYVGSGITEKSVKEFLAAADGVIVGTALKAGGLTSNPIDRDRALRLVKAARGAATSGSRSPRSSSTRRGGAAPKDLRRSRR
jgi:membrane complex biogenesis BtpA family protein